MTPHTVFHLVLIKPSHYDDDGYVLQWAHASTPSNTLAVLYGLALDCSFRPLVTAGVDRQTFWQLGRFISTGYVQLLLRQVLGISEVRATQLRSTEISTSEIGFSEVRPLKVRPLEISVVKPCLDEEGVVSDRSS